jgi:hypothetical protein
MECLLIEVQENTDILYFILQIPLNILHLKAPSPNTDRFAVRHLGTFIEPYPEPAVSAEGRPEELMALICPLAVPGNSRLSG